MMLSCQALSKCLAAGELAMDQCVYHIQLRGQLDEAEVNGMSPLILVREVGDTAMTQFAVNTDQSGLVGLIRHLHGLGYIFLSVSRQ